MSTPREIITNRRPIRELVAPEVERPSAGKRTGEERRRAYRFTRHLPGVMDFHGSEFAVTCIDIGYGGISVVAPAAPQLATGDRATVKINYQGQSFQDEFSVLCMEAGSKGTSIHLAL